MNDNNYSRIEEGAGCLPLLFSFLIPLVGIILYFAWKPTRPRAAGQACTWAIIGIIGLPIIYFIAVSLGLIGGLAMFW